MHMIILSVASRRAMSRMSLSARCSVLFTSLIPALVVRICSVCARSAAFVSSAIASALSTILRQRAVRRPTADVAACSRAEEGQGLDLCARPSALLSCARQAPRRPARAEPSRRARCMHPPPPPSY